MEGNAVVSKAFSLWFAMLISGTPAVSNSLEVGGTAASNKGISILLVISISGSLIDSDPVRK